jgi:hypothetical protein
MVKVVVLEPLFEGVEGDPFKFAIEKDKGE